MMCSLYFVFTLLCNSAVVWSLKDLTHIFRSLWNEPKPEVKDDSTENTQKLESWIRRTGEHFEWGWDKWCLLQPRVGDCQDRRILYYYQAETDSCQEFIYTGCHGNENKFTNKKECEQFCKGYGQVLETKNLTQAEKCSLQPNPGNCLSLKPRYYFDINTHRCNEFSYGGCGGNANRFKNVDSCSEKCSQFYPRYRVRS